MRVYVWWAWEVLLMMVSATPALSSDSAALAVPVSSVVLSNDRSAHITQLEAFYKSLGGNPKSREAVEKLFATYGETIWTSLEKKYPGKTAAFVKVSPVVFV
jgi:hypothetical protein